MEVPHEISRASKLVTELTLLQLLTCFLFSLARADPFVVATLVGLYAVRENDRRALDLYLLLVGVGGALDVLFLLIFEPSPIVLIGTLFGLVLKLAIVSPCYQLWEIMPPTRLASLTPDGVTAHVKSAVAAVLTKHAQTRSLRSSTTDGAASTISPPRHPVRPAPLRLPKPQTHTPTVYLQAGTADVATPEGSRSATEGASANSSRVDMNIRGGGGGSWEAV